MDDLAQYIENWTDLPVVNRTALSGLFAVSTEGWKPMRLPPPPPSASHGPELRRPSHHLHRAGQARSRTETARSHRAGLHRGSHRAPGGRLIPSDTHSSTTSRHVLHEPAQGAGH